MTYYYSKLEKGTTVQIIKKPPYKEYDVEIGDIGVVTYVASSGKYSVHIDGKRNPHEDKKRVCGEDGDFWIPSECIKPYEYKKGDRVQIVTSKSKYKNQYGIVANNSNRYYVKVYIDGINYTIEYALNSVKLIRNEENIMKLTGFKKVAVIEMSNTNYFFALFDEDINVGDTVLVSGSAIGKLLTIKEILTTKEAKEKCNKTITAEVMCKVNLSAYNKRVENRKKAEELRKEMDKKIAEMDEINKYIMYAERSPELMEMFNKYKELI